MYNLMKLLKSRRVWAIIVMFLIGGFEGISGMIPGAIVTPVLGVLGVAATYFSFNPSQNYEE